ncbi:glycosyltransferase family 2 protein [Clostridium sp. AM58-1XD]|uniref:glycosyltransferase family 2 protein n=1 Tax=Clostridium sp. AM58-1XD TaxID=2292307 RepID=UPI000E5239A5|nr:glycosyltransferase family 2 protein [Clostridium sp. AM58-1XD]RGY98913.1 glycosyltransferase [Clostridium sp. AM58-1XD]
MSRTVSVVVSVYNEEQALPEFYRESVRVLSQLNNHGSAWDYELLFVNDGSRDKSLDILEELAKQDSRVKVVSFSRNFGHEAAMIAGLDYSSGEAVICMDSDLQHPPECIPEILKKMDEGYEVINMVRTKNRSAGILKNVTSSGFYWFINAVSDVKFEANASDFFAVSRRVTEILKKSYREKVRFLRGYVQNLGFRKVNLEYEARERVAGKSKYSLKKLFQFAVNTILCFSNMPLKLGIYAGLCSGGLGLVVMFYTVYTWTKIGAPPGYATIVVLICFMFSVLFFLVGIIGEYIAILFNELKDRPVYIVEKLENIQES